MRYFLCLTFALLLFIFPTVVLAQEEPSVSARSAVLICADDNKVLFQKNADERLPMASTTKIMTCLIALENGNPSDVVTIPDEAVGTEGSSLYLAKGDIATLMDLLYGVMLRSANDAAATVAVHIGGSIESFADMMNNKANELGLTNTHFTNPHGLPNDNHYTTARDFALLSSYAMKNPDFVEIVSTAEYTVSLNGGETKKPIVNHNKMLRLYEGANGIKTGFTKASGRCLVSSAQRDGVTMIAVTLNAPADWSDHSALLDYGFSRYERITVMEKGSFVRQFDIVGGSLEITNAEAFTATLEKGTEITVKTECDHIIFPPVCKGEIIGQAVIYANGTEIGRVPLAASNAIVITEKSDTLPKKIRKHLKQKY